MGGRIVFFLQLADERMTVRILPTKGLKFGPDRFVNIVVRVDHLVRRRSVNSTVGGGWGRHTARTGW